MNEVDTCLCTALFKPGCPTLTTVSVIGGKWKIPILYMLLSGPQRPSELQRRLPGVNRQVLTAQLRELEHDGVVSRTEYGEVPPRVEYQLTSFGQTLKPALGALYRWGEEYQNEVNKEPSSAAGSMPKKTYPRNRE